MNGYQKVVRLQGCKRKQALGNNFTLSLIVSYCLWYGPEARKQEIFSS